MAKVYTMRVRAVEGVNVPNMAALEMGVRRVVGKDADGSVRPEGETMVCSGKDASNHRSFYAKGVRLGELVAIDAETAAMAGVTFQAPASAPQKPTKGKDGDP
jgi:hypothetical protein